MYIEGGIVDLYYRIIENDYSVNRASAIENKANLENTKDTDRLIVVVFIKADYLSWYGEISRDLENSLLEKLYQLTL